MPQKPDKQARRRASGPDLRVSPLLAYREGASIESWNAPSPFAAGCIAIATMLHAATRESSSTVREQLLDRATDRMAELLEPGKALRGSSLDAVIPRTALLPFITAADRLQRFEDAPPALACHMFESLAALVPPDSIDAGRVLSARIMYGYGDVHNDLRTELSRRLIVFGFRLRNAELLSRGWAHLMGRALATGNLPLAEKASRHCYKHALTDGDQRLISSALNMRGIVAGMRGDISGSIELLWEAFQMCDHSVMEAQLLANLGETLYRAGRFREARAARARALLKPHGRFAYISLGGYAACCAALEDVGGVTWAAGQAMLLGSSARPSRALAQGIMGVADACGAVEMSDLAKTLYERGRAMADAYGFHDLRFRADPSLPHPRSTPRPLEGRVTSTLESIAMLAPDGVPTDAVLTW